MAINKSFKKMPISKPGQYTCDNAELKALIREHLKCECGLDHTRYGGKHSYYCPKAEPINLEILHIDSDSITIKAN